MNRKIYVSLLAIIIVSSATAFYCGMQYQKKNSNEAPEQFARRGGGSMASGTPRTQRGGDAGFMSGEIVSIDDKSISIKLPNGGSKIVFFGSETSIMRSVSGKTEDLSIGSTISMMGTTNPDGSMNAKSIQLRAEKIPQ